MKAITELIDYFISSGELDEFDLRFLEEQGFYEPPYDDLEDEDEPYTGIRQFGPSSHFKSEEEAEEAALRFAENEALKTELGTERKGMGRRHKPSVRPRLSLDELNERILAKTSEWDDHFKVLAAFTGLPKQGLDTLLRQQDAATADREQISRQLTAMLLQQASRLAELKNALFFTGHLDFVFEQLNNLKPKQRETVRRWLLGKAPGDSMENRDGFRLINHCARLQRAVIMEWAQHHAHMLKTEGFFGEIYFKFHNYDPQVSLAFLLLEYSEKDLSVPELPHPVHYFFEENDLSPVFGYFLSLFPRRFHYLFQNARQAGQAIGTEQIKHPLARQLAWMPIPDWMNRHCNESERVWATEKPSPKLELSGLEMETDWFNIAGRFSPKEFFMEAKGFARCEREYLYGAKPCSEGRLAVCLQRHTWGFVDRHGKWVIPAKYQEVESFSEGLALVKDKNTYAYIDLFGKKQFETTSESPGSFSEGLAALNNLNGRLHYVDKSGKYVLSPEAWRGLSFSEGKAGICLPDGLWTFIDKTGRILGENTYDQVHNFREGRAVVKQNDLFGFIDEHGKEVIPCQFEWAWSFNEDRAGVKQNGEWFYIDRDGNRVSAYYDMVEHFSEGMGGVLNGEWTFIDKSGKEIMLPDERNSTAAFCNGFAWVGSKFINTDGEPQPLWYAVSSFSEGFALTRERRMPMNLAIINDKLKLMTDYVFQEFERFPTEFAAFEKLRREEFKGQNLTGYTPYTCTGDRIFFEGTAWASQGFRRREGCQLVFKSEFREGTFEPAKTTLRTTLDGRYLWTEDNGVSWQSDEIIALYHIDNGRMVVEKPGSKYAIVDWGKTMEKLGF